MFWVRFCEQVLQGNRVVPPFPVNADFPLEGCRMPRGFLDKGALGKRYGFLLASGLVPYGWERGPHLKFCHLRLPSYREA